MDQYLIYTHLNIRLVSNSLSRQPAILDPNFLEDQIKLSCCAHSKHAKLIETVYIAVFFDRIQSLAGKSSDEKYPAIFLLHEDFGDFPLPCQTWPLWVRNVSHEIINHMFLG